MFNSSHFQIESGFESPPATLATAGVLSKLRTALPGLGPVVCVHRREDASRLQADASPLLTDAALQVVAEIDSEGPREALRVLRLGGGVLLQVCLLPDSDFLAWDRLLQDAPPPVLQERLCWPAWLTRVRWQAQIGRFRLLDERLRFEPLPATSAFGARSAELWSARCGCGPCRN